MKIEYHIMSIHFVDDDSDRRRFNLEFIAKTEAEAEQWVRDNMPPLPAPTRPETNYTILKVYTNSIGEDE